MPAPYVALEPDPFKGTLRRCKQEDAARYAMEPQYFEAMAKEISATAPHVANYTAEAWRARYAAGQAAIVVVGPAIVAHVSIVCITSVARISALQKAAGARWPLTQAVWESASGWTASSYRRRGYQSSLREILYASVPKADAVFSYCIGVSASPVLARLGWTLVSWAKYPVLSRLVARIGDDRLVHDGYSRVLDGLRPYHGEGSYPVASPPHDWEQFVHLWTRDAAIAQTLEAKFAATQERWVSALERS